ncbi:MAG: hypothetical protein A3I06_01990 [Candidatus Lindowbacteria bacterium RIFCSPLOWO2_02_FULL_62_12]|nr:MAG: hypothetical protein A3I06_01990 [Candidatus Lindowbacteria bacterium RIFCSPLOWO2_02_FULL_62_12]
MASTSTTSAAASGAPPIRTCEPGRNRRPGHTMASISHTSGVRHRVVTAINSAARLTGVTPDTRHRATFVSFITRQSPGFNHSGRRSMLECRITPSERRSTNRRAMSRRSMGVCAIRPGGRS